MLEVSAHLKTLELEPDASLGDIKQAYKDLVTVWHPDRFGHNPRLRKKAESKLKQFNQAYEALRTWRRQPSAHVSSQKETQVGRPQQRRSAGASCRSSHTTPSQARRAQTKRAKTTKASAQDNTHDLGITFATAEYILQHYCFIGDHHSGVQHCYQGGPFVLMASEDPPEVMLSVPCDSLQFFDRILLSIPCKSAGHFKQQEARRLLQLLHAQ